MPDTFEGRDAVGEVGEQMPALDLQQSRCITVEQQIFVAAERLP